MYPPPETVERKSALLTNPFRSSTVSRPKLKMPERIPPPDSASPVNGPRPKFSRPRFRSSHRSRIRIASISLRFLRLLTGPPAVPRTVYQPTAFPLFCSSSHFCNGAK